MPRRVNLLGLLLIFCSSCYFLGPSPAKRLAAIPKEQPMDVAIIPGLPLKNGQWDTLLKTRMLWSLYLYQKGYVKNFIYSGNAVYTKWTEGKAMALYAIKLGIPAEHVFVDTLAEHSTENLHEGWLLARAKGFQSIAVATDPFQCNMLYKYSRKNLPERIHFLPVIPDSISHYYSLNPVIDSNSCVKNGFIPLAERQSYRERLKGTQGKHIQK